MVNSQQLAEQLARLCTSNYADECKTHQPMMLHDVILSTIPLVELLEVARTAKAEYDASEEHPFATQVELGNALQTLREKGIEI